MIEVREVLRRFGAGQAVRRIARETGVGRNTVDRYVAAARARGYEAGEPTDELVAQVAQDVQARPVPEPSEQRLALAARREQIETWLKADGSKFTKVHMLLERQGTEVSYATLRRFVIDEFGWGMRTPSVRVDDPAPGQEAQIDFGCMGLMFDPEKGRSRKLWALSATSGSMTLKIRWLHEGAQRQAATRWSRRVGVFDRGGNPLYRASTEPRLDGRGERAPPLPAALEALASTEPRLGFEHLDRPRLHAHDRIPFGKTRKPEQLDFVLLAIDERLVGTKGDVEPLVSSHDVGGTDHLTARGRCQAELGGSPLRSKRPRRDKTRR